MHERHTKSVACEASQRPAIHRGEKRGLIPVPPPTLDHHAVKWIRDFNARYADQRPQLADATLMYLVDTLKLTDIFTLDIRDFSVYRRKDGVVLSIHPK